MAVQESLTGAGSERADEEKLDFKKIMPVLVIILIDLLGLSIIVPLMPLFAARFGANAFVIGLLGSTYPFMQFIGAPILGRLSDRYGRRPILIVSQVGTLLGFILLGFANALPLLFLSRVIDGLSGANISTAQAVVTDLTSPKTRTQGLGLIGAAFGMGFILGPIIAFSVLIASGDSYQAVCLKDTGRFIGFVALNPETKEDGPAFNIGYVFNFNEHGKGYASEACRAALDHAFLDLQALSVVSGTAAANVASCRLLERLGLRRVAESRGSFRNGPDGEPLEFVGYAYAISRAEWEAGRKG